MPGPFDLAGLLTRGLNAMVVALEDDEVSVPSFRYVTGAQQIALDCEQFVAHVSNLYSGQPGLQSPGPYYDSLDVFNAEIGFTLVREVEIDTNVTQKGLNADGLQTLSDSDALLRAGIKTLDDGSLLGEAPWAQIGPVSWIGPSGGLIGVTLTVVARIL